ncbi:tRNA-binding protein [Marivirga lumbricoides]|uniref:tRNA-binding protein n=1 Tax=Marivirga lumbricoides TaxID=1046115 RepID=A0ABQ1MGL1_9BACT|nr:tRNA-binding protein [Marivirga lumbricoides]
MNTINWADFQKIDIRIGTIVKTEPFPEAKKPAYKVWVDLGEEVGLKKTSAQITVNYTLEQLIGRQVQCVINFPKKQIGNFMSEVLITGYEDENGNIVLASVEQEVPNGAKLY